MPPASDEPSASPVALTSERLNQSERRARTREALMVATAQNITRYGYAQMKLERIANDAGYTRGALYHLFSSKEELVLATVNWVREAWTDQVGSLFDESDPVGTLIAMAREPSPSTPGTIRRESSRVLELNSPELTIRSERRSIESGRISAKSWPDLVTAGRTTGAIPPGAPAGMVAIAYMAAIDGIVNHLSDHAPFDTLFAEKVTLGVLGLPPASVT